MCAIDDAEPWQVVRHSTPTARKPHPCGECGRTIRPGETYQFVTGVVYGESRWDSYRVCRHCDAASAWLRTVCGGYVLDHLLEELVEHWNEGYASILMGRLILGMRRRWNDGADPVISVERVKAVAEWSMARQVAA